MVKQCLAHQKPKNMNRWPRYIGFLVFLLVWLFLISLPAFAFVLATRGQIELGSTKGQQLRIFLVQEEDAEGLGVEWARPLSSQTHCLQTSVRYFLWAGQPQNVTFCQCIDPATDDLLPAVPGPCHLP
jgi:hypothetical protein